MYSPESPLQRRSLNCPPCPPCPPEAYPTGADYFGDIYSPPPHMPEPLSCPTAPPTYVDGRIQRTRAPIGHPSRMDLVDNPGIAFPMPRAALDKGDRPRGQHVPLTPPTCPPTNYGGFIPQGASSPVSTINTY